MEGIIREKAKFPMIRGPDGAVSRDHIYTTGTRSPPLTYCPQIQRAAFSRYFVRTHASPKEEALVDDKHIRRDKKVFTKQHLRSFLKNSLQREPWMGAPWLVKEHLAIHFRLPMEIPGHLLQDAKLIANKVWTSHEIATATYIADSSQQQMLQAKSKGRARTSKPEELARQQHELARMQQMQQQVCSGQQTLREGTHANLLTESRCTTTSTTADGQLPPGASQTATATANQISN